MSLEIDTALSEGARRTVARNGLFLVGVFIAFGFANAVVSQSLSVELLDVLQQYLTQEVGVPPSEIETQTGPTPFAIPLSVPVLSLLMLLGLLVSESLRIVSIRVFVSDHTESVPSELATRRLGLATINGIVAALVVFVLIFFGLILLVVPGLYIAISFFFVRQEIAVEDKSFVDALGDSWGLTAGNRWELLGLAVIVGVINLIAGSLGGAFVFLDPTLSVSVNIVVGGFTTVFGIAVATRAYDQLRRERREKLGRDGDTDGTGTDGNWSSGN